MPWNSNFRISDPSTWPNTLADPFGGGIAPIPYLERLPMSPMEEFRNNGTRTVKEFLVPWESRRIFSRWLLAYTKMVIPGHPTPPLPPDPLPSSGSIFRPTDIAEIVQIPTGGTKPIVAPVGATAPIDPTAGGAPQENRGSQSYLSRSVPFVHADYVDDAGWYYLYAEEVQKVSPLGLTDAVAQHWADPTMPPDPGTDSPTWSEMKTVNLTAQYKFAQLSILFSTFTFDFLTDAEMLTAGFVDSFGHPDESSLARYVTKVQRPVDQYLTLPAGAFQFIYNGAAFGAVPGQPGKIVAQNQVTLTWHFVPEAALATRLYNPPNFYEKYPLDDDRGTVNLYPFMGYPAGTVLLTSVDTGEPIRSPWGTRIYNVKFTFRVFFPGLDINSTPARPRPIGHNHLYGILSSAIPPGGGPPEQFNEYLEVAKGAASNIQIDPTTGKNELGTRGKNIYDWADHRDLFRIPVLSFP